MSTSKQLYWLSDLHFDIRNDYEWKPMLMQYGDAWRENENSAVLISGDISNSTRLKKDLRLIANYFREIPVYIVLGNHDYHFAQGLHLFESELSSYIDSHNLRNIHFLDMSESHQLTRSTLIVGVSGFYDTQYVPEPVSVRYYRDIELADISEIHFLNGASGQTNLNSVINGYSIQFAQKLERKLLGALKDNADTKTVIVLTHVPAFREQCFYRFNPTEDSYIGAFSSGYLGEAIRRVAGQYLNVNFMVLSGHTHHFAVAPNIAPNIVAMTHGQTYDDDIKPYALNIK